MPPGYNKLSLIKKALILCSAPLITALAGCNGAQDSNGQIQGQDQTVHSPIGIPSAPGTPPAGTPSATTVGPSCQGHDSQHFCVGLKYVVYNDSSGQPVVPQSAAITNVAAISQEWSQCQIGFQIDQYVAADPTQYGLTFNTANTSELDMIRQAFDDNSHFLVATTGTWNRAGTLGSTGANAWTNMPGDAIFGAILEEPVGTFPLIIAHELGHYMNLDHVSDPADLMNPIIYSTSTNLDSNQCNAARAALQNFWTAMLR